MKVLPPMVCGGIVPEVMLRNDSIMVVFPAPFCPRIKVKGLKNSIFSSSNGENRGDIRFGLHPSEVFESSQNFGAYHEYEHHSNGHIDRGFTFQLDNHGNASFSDFTDDDTALSSHSSRHSAEKGDSHSVDDND